MSKKPKSILCLRKEIDQIDQVIAKQLTERTIRAHAIIQLKKINQLPALDHRREDAIFKVYYQELKKISNKDLTKKTVQSIIELNTEYPKRY